MREIKFRAWDKQIKNEPKMVYNNDWSYYELMYCMESCTVMQYTGLKDKNGKEIYEGDIVRGSEINSTFTDMEIIFANGSFMVKQLRAEKLGDDLFRHCNRVEVIGNIYENKELLKGK